MSSDPTTRLNAALEGRYRIEREFGEGGMATVYLAADLKHERKVASVIRSRSRESMSRSIAAALLLSSVIACSETATNPDPNPVPSRVTLSETGLDFVSLGETAQLTATVFDQDGTATTLGVTWSIADTDVATVAGGLVTAVANGSTTLTATAGAASSTIEVDVEQVADSVILSTVDVQLTMIGETLQITTDVQDAGGSSMPSAVVIWSEDDPSVATVSAGGTVTGQGAGSTTVTAESGGASSIAAVTLTLPAATSEIVFTSLRDGNDEIYVMDADGSNQVNLTNNPARDWKGVAEPGGGRIILFQTNRDGNEEIYALDRDALGSPPENLTNDAGADVDPAWSWDATKIAFARDGIIWVMDADGGNAQSLGVAGHEPTWSPDGTQIAFMAGGFPGPLFIMNADGSNPVDLAPASGVQDRTPEWSPDGSTIVFAGRIGASGGLSIFTIEPDGSNFDTVQGPIGGLSVGWPTWSPDGSQIAYSGPEASNYNIWVMSADGSGDTMITTALGTDYYPRWIR